MTEPVRIPAPDAVGDVVPGEPPVPITVWHVPAPHEGDTMSVTLADRLVRNFTTGRRWLSSSGAWQWIAARSVPLPTW